MHKFSLSLITFIYFSLLTINAFAKDIPVYVRDDVYHDYKKFTHNKNIYKIKNFTGNNIRRDVVDMILVQQALKLGGFEHKLSLIPGKLNFRNTKMLQNGRLLISLDTYWLKDAEAIKDDIFISAPVIRQGEYVAGIYTSPENKDVLAIKQLKDLEKFSAISTPKWRTDWQTLKSLPLKEVIKEDEWLSMARMVHLKWVDFLLMPFHSSSDQAFKTNTFNLVPVPNIGILMQDSRHFVISAKHPLSDQTFSALNNGLTIMRQNKHIKNAYTQAGFFIDINKVNIINK